MWLCAIESNTKPSTQCGQALPLGMALLLLIALSAIVFFNTSKNSDEKSKVVNAADAAVYSGLVWQARTLNFQAYTNRAMVANQVSIAQLVSLSSWTNYGRIGARNLDTAIGWIPPIAPFTQALEQGAEQLENVVTQIAEIAVPVIDNTNAVLSMAQEGAYGAAYIATPQVVSTVVKANDSRYRATSTFAIAAQTRNAAAWSQLSARKNESLSEKETLINASLDAFSDARAWDALPGLATTINVGPIDRFRIVKEGSTRLEKSGDDYQWRGKDGLSLHWQHYSCGLGGCGWENSEIPMGWGQTVTDGSTRCTNRACGKLLEDNELAEQFANESPVNLDSNYGGLRAYRSLKVLSDRRQSPNLVLQVEVEVAGHQVRTAQQLDKLGARNSGQIYSGLESGKLYTEEAHAAGSIASVSAGEVFFKRPVIDGRGGLIIDGEEHTEYASLFNPYWDVRLIEVDAALRGQAWAIRSPGTVSRSGSLRSLSRNIDAALPLHTAEHYGSMGRNALQKLRNVNVRSLGKGVLKRYAGDAVQRFQLADFSSQNEAHSGGEQYMETRALLQEQLLDNEGLSDTLLANASLEDAINSIAGDLSVEATSAMQAQFSEQFNTELQLRESLQDIRDGTEKEHAMLSNTVDDSQRLLSEGIEKIATAYGVDAKGLQQKALDMLSLQLDETMSKATESNARDIALGSHLGALVIQADAASGTAYAQSVADISEQVEGAKNSRNKRTETLSRQSEEIVQQILSQEESALKAYKAGGER